MATKDATQVIKKPRRTDLPNAVELPKGDNNKYTTFALAIMKFPRIDIKDPELVGQRITDYFQLCADSDMKPTVTAMALALGLDRRRLWEINTDQRHQGVVLPEECKQMIKMAYNSLEVLWESYMTNGKINPVSGIFLGKNHFGYQDKQEYVVTPNTMAPDTPVEVIEAKYDALPED